MHTKEKSSTVVVRLIIAVISCNALFVRSYGSMGYLP